MGSPSGRRVETDDIPFSVPFGLRSGTRPPARARRQVLRLRPGKEVRLPFVLADQPVHERVAVLGGAELRDVHELWPRLLGDRMHAPDAEDVESIDAVAAQSQVDLPDHFLLTVRM